MTARRAVFLDIDGTYATRGVVPPGNVAAVQAARQAGHLVFLCTGRPRSMLPQRILATGFDGLVAGGGAYVLLGEEVIADLRFPADLAARTVAVLDRYDVAYLLEAPEAIYAAPGIHERLARLFAEHLSGPSTGQVTDADELDDLDEPGASDILQQLRVVEDRTDLSFGKVSCFDTRVPMDRIGAEIGDGIGVLPNSVPGLAGEGGELFMTGVHKALGMRLMVERLGLSREDVVGIGDGANDIEMLEYAGVGIAIEGADVAVLAAADRTAAAPEQEGVATALAELGLI